MTAPSGCFQTTALFEYTYVNIMLSHTLTISRLNGEALVRVAGSTHHLGIHTGRLSRLASHGQGHRANLYKKRVDRSSFKTEREPNGRLVC